MNIQIDNNSKIAIIVQARCGSTRLPAKVLKPFDGDKCLLDILITKLKCIGKSRIIIATSINVTNNPIEDICKGHGVDCFRGSENDVLKRFIDAATYYDCNRIIRICSDNPFLELKALNELVEYSIQKEEYDYISFKVDEKPSIQTHYGFWAEYVTLDALKRIQTATNESLYHEHVTNYIYSHCEEFKIGWLKTPSILVDRKRLRLTIDTETDFNTVKTIYSNITQTIDYPTIEDVVKYLDNNAQYYALMEKEILNNSK